LNYSINEFFKILLLNSLKKFYYNKIIIFNNKIIPLVDNIENTLKICEKSYFIQKYLQNFFFRHIITDIYPFCFIQITEINTNISIDKYNLNCHSISVPIQINYCILGNEINITISNHPDQDNIKLIIPELYKQFNI